MLSARDRAISCTTHAHGSWHRRRHREPAREHGEWRAHAEQEVGGREQRLRHVLRQVGHAIVLGDEDRVIGVTAAVDGAEVSPHVGWRGRRRVPLQSERQRRDREHDDEREERCRGEEPCLQGASIAERTASGDDRTAGCEDHEYAREAGPAEEVAPAGFGLDVSPLQAQVTDHSNPSALTVSPPASQHLSFESLVKLAAAQSIQIKLYANLAGTNPGDPYISHLTQVGPDNRVCVGYPSSAW